MEIAPFSSIKLEVLWQPTVPGRVETEFIVSFADIASESVSAEEGEERRRNFICQWHIIIWYRCSLAQ